MRLRHLHRHSAFPFVVVGLTLTLLMFVAFVVRPRPAAPTGPSAGPREEAAAPALTDAEYESAAAEVMRTFDTAYAIAVNDVVRLSAVEETINTLLNLRVTAARRDAHFELVSALYRLRSALFEGEEEAVAAVEYLEAVRDSQAWLE